MRISVFGMGYVGVVTSACMARDGLQVIGVDVNREKVDMVARGQSPIIELGLSELLAEAVKSGRLTATVSADEAVARTDVSLVCVGTPSRADGSLDDSYVMAVCDQIGKAVAAKKKMHTVIIRSTILPGTTAKCAERLRKAAGKQKVHVAFNPEFLREGTAIRDYDYPPYTVVGTDDADAEEVLRQVYASVNAPLIVTDVAVAEMIKYTANAWHAAKITFANEIGRVAKAVNVDARKVMDIITQDTKLNVSQVYMRPGFAYGGSCLPKDLRAINYFAGKNSISLPMLGSLDESNRQQLAITMDRIAKTGCRRIGMLGLAFKAGTDDLRESPAVELAERLIGKGYELKIMDRYVQEAKLIGANRSYIEEKIPHLSVLLADWETILKHAELLVICNDTAEFRNVVASAPKSAKVLDLVGLFKTKPDDLNYDGISW
ncbi:MAG: nucleotide sugar dehydrogenase [Kiritimatiellia bacterium]